MQRLAETLERQVNSKVREGLVVWLDREGLYTEFVDGLARRRAQGNFSAPVLGYRGSYLELLAALEPYEDGLDPEPLLLHVPGHTDVTIRGTPLLEAYRAGTRFERALPTLVREVAAGQVSAAEVERFLSQEKLSLSGAEEWLQSQLDQEQTGSGAALAHWKPEHLLCALLNREKDPECDSETLLAYVERHTGLSDAFLQTYLGSQKRERTALAECWMGWLLCVEYVHDLGRPASDPLLSPLKSLSTPLRKASLAQLDYVRKQRPDDYRRLANQTEPLIEADLIAGKPEELGKIDTFSREDSRLLEAAVDALLDEEWARALEWATVRIHSPSVWLFAEPLRLQEWKLVQSQARLGAAISAQTGSLKKTHTLTEAVELYASDFFQVDQAHRIFEQEKLRLLEPRMVHFESLSQAATLVRKLYHRWVDALNREFTDLCLQHGFLPEPALQQRNLYEQVVHPLTQQKDGTVVYFLVDGLRYEMAAELSTRLEKAGLVMHLKPRLAELPSITRVGMNVLAPVQRQGNLKVNGQLAGFRAGEYVVNAPEQRLRAMGDRSLDSLPGGRRSPVGLTLADVQNETPKSLKKKIGKCPLVVVHSREVDTSGESNLGLATFETWLGQLYSAINLLRAAGVDQFVITSDHGFLLIDESREPVAVKSDDRRFLHSESQLSHEGLASVSTASLAYEGMPGYLVFPRDSATFPGKGSKGFVHGGNSLQERVIPVLTLSYRNRELLNLGQYVLEAEALTAVLNHSRLRVRLREGENMLLGFENKSVAVALRVPEFPNVRVVCKQVSGADLVHQQILLTVGADWAEIIFVLEGSGAARANVELYHPDGQESLQPKRLAEFFNVLGPLVAVEPAPTPTSWEEHIADPGHRQVFVQLHQEGVIDEDQIVHLLGSPSASRKFARKFEDYVSLLPFQIGIESHSGLKRYVKKG